MQRKTVNAEINRRQRQYLLLDGNHVVTAYNRHFLRDIEAVHLKILHYGKRHAVIVADYRVWTFLAELLFQTFKMLLHGKSAAQNHLWRKAHADVVQTNPECNYAF